MSVISTVIKQFVDRLGRTIIAFFYPKKCLGCGYSGLWLCPSCIRALDYAPFQRCLNCGKAAIGGYTHPSCETRYTADRTLAPFEYKEPLREAIHLAKYHNQWDIFNELVERAVLWLDHMGVKFLPEAVLVPVPLHFARKWQRGYNQASILAQNFGKTLALPVEEGFLARTRNTQSQTRLSKKERSKNVKDAFVCQKDLSGRNIVLVDDVFSSGSTLKAVAKELKKNHARTVWCLTLARS